MQAAIRSKLVAEPCSFLDDGERVRLKQGPLAGVEGFLVEVAAHRRVVVSLTILRRSMAVDIDGQPVESLAVGATASDR